MAKTKNQVLRETTLDYLHTINLQNPPDAATIESDLMQRIYDAFELENSVKPKGQKWLIPTTLSFSQIAEIIAYLYPVCKISCAGENADADYDLLAVYQTDGPNKGIYVTSEDTFRQLARQFNYTMSSKEFDETMLVLRDKVPRRSRCNDPDLIAVNNGIFNYTTKTLMDFTPEQVFLTKSKVDYDPNALNITIHNNDDGTDWDVESWMESLSDDPEIVNLLWEILGAIIRPNVRWNKSAWLYSDVGNNGKGTLCELMRLLCGAGSYASIAISDFSKDFVLEPLTRASAIIVDENDVGVFIDKAANLKAVITNDVIQINRKFKSPIAYQFYGFMVQCLNEFPRIRDKSDSFYRRQLFIPMTKCFTGRERRYIKTDYIHRDEVLRYVLHRVLHMNYYHLSEPAACTAVLAEYREFNDPIRQFFEELSPQFTWDLLPFPFLYELYKSWFRRNSPSGSVQGKNTFINDLLNVVKNDDTWFCADKAKAIRSDSRMNRPEPLIAEYDLSDWKNPNYRGDNMSLICTPFLQASYRGLQRYQVVGAPSDGDDGITDDSLD